MYSSSVKWLIHVESFYQFSVHCLFLRVAAREEYYKPKDSSNANATEVNQPSCIRLSEAADCSSVRSSDFSYLVE